MNNKKARLFLWISLAVFALSAVAVLISSIELYYELLVYPPPNDPSREFMPGFELFVYIFIMVPALAIELFCIRSVYKILKHEPKGIIKICYLISAILSFSEFVFQCLIFAGLINLENMGNIPNFTATVLIFTQWPVFILSFVLGSIPIKYKT